MANTKSLTVYLAGPMEDIPDGGVQWRDRITPKLIEYFGDRIIVQDPCKMENEKLKGFVDPDIPLDKVKEVLQGWRQGGHWDKFDPAIEHIIDMDLDCVEKSNFIIIFLRFTNHQGKKIQMGGTISELSYAYRHRIPIYAVTYNTISECNSWIIRMARGKTKVIEDRKIYPNFAQALEAIKEDYKEFKALKKEAEKALEEFKSEQKPDILIKEKNGKDKSEKKS